MVPLGLHTLSIAILLFGFGSAIVIAIDETRHPQHMWIMNVVWPVTALFGTAMTLCGYFAYGRRAAHEATHGKTSGKRSTPFPIMVGKGAAHCGSGCALGDIAAEWLAFAVRRPRSRQSGVLVHDADRNDLRIPHLLSGELLADPRRNKGRDVDRDRRGFQEFSKSFLERAMPRGKFGLDRAGTLDFYTDSV